MAFKADALKTLISDGCEVTGDIIEKIRRVHIEKKRIRVLGLRIMVTGFDSPWHPECNEENYRGGLPEHDGSSLRISNYGRAMIGEPRLWLTDGAREFIPTPQLAREQSMHFRASAPPLSSARPAMGVIQQSDLMRLVMTMRPLIQRGAATNGPWLSCFLPTR